MTGDLDHAGREEVLSALNELLEAERAGARVALASLKAAPDPDYAELMRAVRADEAQWCAMLTRRIREAGGTPSPKCGAFFGKAMAIADPAERLAFLNRGQAWVVRRLDGLAPRVANRGLQADLQAMAESHRSNIRLTDAFLERRNTAI